MNRFQQWKPILPLVAALFYGVSPLDLVPDVIPVLGLVDDALIAPALILLGVMQFRRHRQLMLAQKHVIQPGTALER